MTKIKKNLERVFSKENFFWITILIGIVLVIIAMIKDEKSFNWEYIKKIYIRIIIFISMLIIYGMIKKIMIYIIKRWKIEKKFKPIVTSKIFEIRYVWLDILGYIDTFVFTIYPLYIESFIEYYLKGHPCSKSVGQNPILYEKVSHRTWELVQVLIENIILTPFLVIVYGLSIIYGMLSLYERIEEKFWEVMIRLIVGVNLSVILIYYYGSGRFYLVMSLILILVIINIIYKYITLLIYYIRKKKISGLKFYKYIMSISMQRKLKNLIDIVDDMREKLIIFNYLDIKIDISISSRVEGSKLNKIFEEKQEAYEVATNWVDMHFMNIPKDLFELEDSEYKVILLDMYWQMYILVGWSFMYVRNPKLRVLEEFYLNGCKLKEEEILEEVNYERIGAILVGLPLIERNKIWKADHTVRITKIVLKFISEMKEEDKKSLISLFEKKELEDGRLYMEYNMWFIWEWMIIRDLPYLNERKFLYTNNWIEYEKLIEYEKWEKRKWGRE